jgi:hypothetical protein
VATPQHPHRHTTKLRNRTVPLDAQGFGAIRHFISYDNLTKQGSLPEGSLPDLMQKNDFQPFIEKEN